VAYSSIGPSGPLLQVSDLAVHFFSKRGIVKAVDQVSFDLQPGERLAIVGESGSGKSVMSMSMMQLVSHPGRIMGGSVRFDGRDLLKLNEREMNHVRGKDVAMIFQDPMASLNPVLTVEDQITAPLRRHMGISKSAARVRAIELLAQVGIPAPAERLASYPHQLSGGMRQRVLIAMALACGPKLLLADEPTTALDVTIQAQIVALLKDLSDRMNMAVVFVTHDLGLVARFAHRVAVMYAGRFVELGTAEELFGQPGHPYTEGLLGSIPAIVGDRPSRLVQIPGSPPDLVSLGASCPFEPRCAYAHDRCLAERPPLQIRPGRSQVACWTDITTPSNLKEVALVGR
jgi:peptide/nickel transport system ATP-binding protein